MRIRIGVLILLSLNLTGCLVTVDSDYTASAHWDDDDVAQIRVGETGRQWIVETFGAPNTKEEKGDDGEIWHYKNISERETKIGLFLLFHINLERQRHRNLHIEMRDNTVVDYWSKTEWVE